MIEIPYKDEILSASKSSGIPASVIAGIIKIESSFNPLAYRFESRRNEASYGLMQVLKSTAQEVISGYGIITDEILYDPTQNIAIGTKYLLQLYTKYNNMDDAISAYNQGNPRKASDGKYVNQVYVDNVKWWANVFDYLLPYGNYIVPTVLILSGLGIVLWEKYHAKGR